MGIEGMTAVMVMVAQDTGWVYGMAQMTMRGGLSVGLEHTGNLAGKTHRTVVGRTRNGMACRLLLLLLVGVHEESLTQRLLVLVRRILYASPEREDSRPNHRQAKEKESQRSDHVY